MYNLILVLSMLSVVLAPLLLDSFLNFEEARLERRARRSGKQTGRGMATASLRPR